MRASFDSIGRILFVIVLANLLLVSCSSVPHVSDSDIQHLRNLDYQGIYGKTVTLKDGIYEGRPYVKGGVSRPRVQLIEQLMVFGDMTGDGHDEAALFLTESGGGSGSFVYLAVVTKSGRNYRNIATRNLGDRVQIRSLRLVEGTLILDFITAGPDDALCCPTQKVRSTYRLVGNNLQQISDKELDALSLRDLEGVDWILFESRQDTLPAGVSVFAVFENDRVAGSSGCNRYFGAIKGKAPHAIEIGPVGATRMMCAGPNMQVEDHYLAALQKVSRFGFYFGQLMLGYEDNGKPQRLLFNPKIKETTK